MNWAQSRKFIYIGSIVIIFLLVVVLPLIIHFYKPPTCFDGKQNQDELGMDCGGVCTLLCRTQYVAPIVNWSRFTRVSDGVYNVLAHIENPNLNAGVEKIKYVFKLYDKDKLLLRERYGETSIPANKIIAIFEPEMYTGNLIPSKVEFAFLPPTVWVKQESAETNLSVSEAVITQEDTAPRLSAVLTNKSVAPVRNIEAVGIVYNAEGNALAFSRTLVDVLTDKQSLPIYFNWPQPFSLTGQAEAHAQTEIVLKILK